MGLRRGYELAAGRTLDPGIDAFDDDNDSTHQASINKLAAVGMVSGTGGRTYAPAATVNRAQMASFLARALDRLVSDGKATPPRR